MRSSVHRNKAPEAGGKLRQFTWETHSNSSDVGIVCHFCIFLPSLGTRDNLPVPIDRPVLERKRGEILAALYALYEFGKDIVFEVVYAQLISSVGPDDIGPAVGRRRVHIVSD
jgi:hypothetical protein